MSEYKKLRLIFLTLMIFNVLFVTVFSLNSAAMVLDDDSTQLIPQFEELAHLTDTGGDTFEVIVDEDLMIVMDMQGGLEFYDISTPSSPILLSSFYDGGIPHNMHLVGDLLYMADHTQGLEIYNVSNPALPIKLGSIADSGDGEMDGVFVLDNQAFVAEWHDSSWDWSMKVINVTDPTNPQELTEYTDGDNKFIRFFVENDLCYTACLEDGLKVLNVTDISNITELAHFNNSLSYTFGLKKVNDLIYLPDGSGLHILNVSNINAISRVTQYSIDEPAFGIEVSNGIAYLGVHLTGVVLINVTNSGQTDYLGKYPTDKIVSIVVQDDLMFITMHNDGLKIIKITWITSTEALSVPLFSLFFLIPLLLPIIRKRK